MSSTLPPIVGPLVTGLIVAAIGSLVSWIIYKRGLRERTARELLSEALVIQALEEAWIVEGDDEDGASKIKLHEHPKLSEKNEPTSKARLRRVEVRAVLDEAFWNSPQTEPY